MNGTIVLASDGSDEGNGDIQIIKSLWQGPLQTLGLNRPCLHYPSHSRFAFVPERSTTSN